MSMLLAKPEKLPAIPDKEVQRGRRIHFLLKLQKAFGFFYASHLCCTYTTLPASISGFVGAGNHLLGELSLSGRIRVERKLNETKRRKTGIIISIDKREVYRSEQAR